MAGLFRFWVYFKSFRLGFLGLFGSIPKKGLFGLLLFVFLLG
jgi:hypothetical protein